MDPYVAAFPIQPALHGHAVGLGTRHQSLAFSHQHVLISCFLWPVIDHSITKVGVYCRKGGGEKIQTKQGLVEPPSPVSVKDQGRSCRPSWVSIVCASAWWWELLASSPRAEICSADAFPRKIRTTGRWWFLKELSLWKKKMHFVKGRILRALKMLHCLLWQNLELILLKNIIFSDLLCFSNNEFPPV